MKYIVYEFSSVQSLSRVWLFVTPWTTACQASLSITNFQSPPKRMSIESMMPSNHLILCHLPFLLPYSVPASGSFQMNQLFISGGQSIEASASTSVLQMNTWDWSPLEWTGWISLQSKVLSRVFSNTTVQKYQFFDVQLSLFFIYLFFTFFFFKSAIFYFIFIFYFFSLIENYLISIHVFPILNPPPSSLPTLTSIRDYWKNHSSE